MPSPTFVGRDGREGVVSCRDKISNRDSKDDTRNRSPVKYHTTRAKSAVNEAPPEVGTWSVWIDHVRRFCESQVPSELVETGIGDLRFD